MSTHTLYSNAKTQDNVVKDGIHWLMAALLLTGSVKLLWLIVCKDMNIFLGQILVDDALYYLIPAQNFLKGSGSSFDGAHLTNGYHPLWFLVNLLIALIEDPIWRIRMLSFVGGLFYVAGVVVVCFGTFRKKSLPTKMLIFLLFGANFTLLRIFLQGLENGLTFFLLAVLTLFYTVREQFSEKQALTILGMLLAFLALSRVDTFLFVLLICVAEVLARRNKLHKKTWRQLLAPASYLCFPIVILFGGYLLSNVFFFNTLFPVSGKTKLLYESEWLASGYPHGGFLQNMSFHFRYVADLSVGGYVRMLDQYLFDNHSIVLPRILPIWLVVGASALAAFIGLGIIVFLARKQRELKIFVFIIGYALFHLVLYGVTFPHFTLYNTWYFTFEYFVFVLGFAFFFEFLWSFFYRRRESIHKAAVTRISATLSIGICLILAVSGHHSATHFGTKDDSVNRFYLAAQWVNNNLPREVTIGAFSSGILSYFVNDRRIVNLDGVINSKEYYDVLKEGRFSEYVRSYVDYFADYSTVDLEAQGLCWQGSCVEPQYLTLIYKWRINESETYYILMIN